MRSHRSGADGVVGIAKCFGMRLLLDVASTPPMSCQEGTGAPPIHSQLHKSVSGPIRDFLEVPVSSPEFGLGFLLFQLLRSAPGTGRTWKGWYEQGYRPDRFR